MIDSIYDPASYGFDAEAVAAVEARIKAKIQARLVNGYISAEDAAKVREELFRDPEYRRMFDAVEAAREERARMLAEAEAPIVRDLRAAGFRVDSVWDVVNSSEPYFEALPVLMDHLERGGYPDRVMESLGRALAVKPSVVYWDRLKARYLDPRGSGEEEGAAIALAAAATKRQLPDLIGFVEDEQRGDVRIYFLRPIKRLGGEEGLQLLERLRDDPVLGREATALLRKRRR